jgi:hypothetical protein
LKPTTIAENPADRDLGDAEERFGFAQLFDTEVRCLPRRSVPSAEGSIEIAGSIEQAAR